jgi:hypothetical protein
MLLSRHQDAGQKYDIKIGNTCFENAAQLKYLGTTVRNRNLTQEEINRSARFDATLMPRPLTRWLRFDKTVMSTCSLIFDAP